MTTKFFEKQPVDIFFAEELALITLFIVMGLELPMLNLGALVICAWMILFERGLDHIFDLMFYLLALSSIFRVGLDGFALYNILTLMVVLRLLLANNLGFSMSTVIPMALILYSLFGIRSANKAELIRFICQTLIGATVLSEARMRGSLSAKRKNTMMSLGVIVSSVIALMADSFPTLKRYLVTYGANIKLGSQRYYDRFMGVEINSNVYTLLISIALAVYAVYLIEKKLNWMDCCIILVLLYFGAITASMSFVASVALVAVFVVFFSTFRDIRVLINTALLLALLGGAMYLLCGKSEAMRTILFRIQKNMQDNADLSSVTTGRSDIWMEYIQYLLENPAKLAFGIGLSAKLPFRAPHNYYIETVVYLGLAGGLLYFAAYSVIYSPSRYTAERCSLYRQLPLLMLLFRGMARCLICEEKIMFIYLLYTLTAIQDMQPKPPASQTLPARGR